MRALWLAWWSIGGMNVLLLVTAVNRMRVSIGKEDARREELEGRPGGVVEEMMGVLRGGLAD